MPGSEGVGSGPGSGGETKAVGPAGGGGGAADDDSGETLERPLKDRGEVSIDDEGDQSEQGDNDGEGSSDPTDPLSPSVDSESGSTLAEGESVVGELMAKGGRNQNARASATSQESSGPSSTEGEADMGWPEPLGSSNRLRSGGTSSPTRGSQGGGMVGFGGAVVEAGAGGGMSGESSQPEYQAAFSASRSSFTLNSGRSSFTFNSSVIQHLNMNQHVGLREFPRQS